ncbi:ABC transporter substrate-binding protein [uncultured Ruegeria sp.]|uniref:heme/hemin ABC transporter substrate-binding protein n=1 Tax=uncultured Ruegeria sp. TaxID=259304 RepID=UPI0026178B93|nr:ABC transporter substrate-binding protein [uncultured Ruegeria sp.]
MNKIRLIWSVLAALLSTQAVLAENDSPKRIIAIGSSITEIVYALGQQDRLVGRDRTSTYPTEVLELPDIGYRRSLSPEGVLSVEPDLILALEGSGPPDAIAVLQQAGVQYITIKDEFSLDGVIEKIQTVGAVLGVDDAAEDLVTQTKRQLSQAQTAAHNAAASDPKRVLFILSTQDNRITVGGVDTQADSIIRLAGGVNAADSVTGYKPLTPEAMASAAPDVILMMDRQGNHDTEDHALFSLPSIKLTPAGRNKRLIRMQGAFLLGFGPRTASAISDLSAALQDVGDS